MQPVYLDNAGTTPPSPAVIQAISQAEQETWGNASSTHFFGRHAKQALENARIVLANSINAQPGQIVLTSGGSESDNTAVVQTALARQHLGKHIITDQIEHKAILESMKYLETLGFDVTYLPVDETGHVAVADVAAALRDDTILVSIMYGNNEIGSRQPIAEIGELLKNHQAWFHTDAVQAYGLTDIDVVADHIDLLSTSAHKINGPKFMGFLFESDNVHFKPLIKGGDQEKKRRAGTENVPGVIGFATAVKALTPAVKAARQAQFAHFKQMIVGALQDAGIKFAVNGSLAPTELQHVLNLWLPGVPTDALLVNLDLAGFAVSGGSACTAGSLEPSHVLTAMFGSDSPRLRESIRISFGSINTDAQIQDFAEKLVQIAGKMQTKNAQVLS
ncbi:MAG: cysteine desulfurase [Schleiferilactobacillus harbinensis]|jgi:cysteine desulfurase|nr:cysteine desulfurase [Schleiferilactobacillus harbinensis]MCI1913171.1 cysteine desulfurase [Schleiferilactobacillus harbinensis]